MLCRVITLSSGLRALLISDHQSAADSSKSADDDQNLSQNGEHGADTAEDGAELSCMQDQFSVEYDHDVGDDAAGIIESDDGDTSWTDVSSDADMSDSSMHDLTSDSASNSKKVIGKKRSQHKQSASNVHVCSGEKLVSVFLSYSALLWLIEKMLIFLGFDSFKEICI